MLATLAVALAFLLGALLGGQLMGRLRGLNLQATGSGNIGATNALRAGGPALGLAVLAFDLGKGALAGGVLPMIEPDIAWLPWLCGTAVVVGHVYSPLAGFAGGKGAATLIGVYLVLLPWGLLLALPAFALVLVLTGWVSASVLTGGLVIALYTACWHAAGLLSVPGAFAAGIWVFLMWTHRDNLRRILARDERRFARVMLIKP